MLLRTRRTQIPLFSRKSFAQSRNELPRFSKFYCCEYVPPEKNNTKLTTVTRFFDWTTKKTKTSPSFILSRKFSTTVIFCSVCFLFELKKNRFNCSSKFSMEKEDALSTKIPKKFCSNSFDVFIHFPIKRKVEKPLQLFSSQNRKSDK